MANNEVSVVVVIPASDNSNVNHGTNKYRRFYICGGVAAIVIAAAVLTTILVLRHNTSSSSPSPLPGPSTASIVWGSAVDVAPFTVGHLTLTWEQNTFGGGLPTQIVEWPLNAIVAVGDFSAISTFDGITFQFCPGSYVLGSTLYCGNGGTEVNVITGNSTVSTTFPLDYGCSISHWTPFQVTGKSTSLVFRISTASSLGLIDGSSILLGILSYSC